MRGQGAQGDGGAPSKPGVSAVARARSEGIHRGEAEGSKVPGSSLNVTWILEMNDLYEMPMELQFSTVCARALAGNAGPKGPSTSVSFSTPMAEIRYQYSSSIAWGGSLRPNPNLKKSGYIG